MKKYLSLTTVFLCATVAVSIAAPDKEALMAKEKSAWQAFKDKKADDFKKVVSTNLVALYASGPSDLQGELADMPKTELKSFTISDYKIVAEGPDTVVTTYKVTTEATRDGKDISGTFYAASVWKNDGGEWKAIFHTDTGPSAPAKPTS